MKQRIWSLPCLGDGVFARQACANKRARVQAEEQLRHKIEEECRGRMLVEMEDSLRQERARGEAAAEESRKVLEGEMTTTRNASSGDADIF